MGCTCAGITFSFGDRLETKVVVAMRLLSVAAGANHIDLRCHLVTRAEPGFRHGQKHPVREIFREYGRRSKAELFLRIPDPVIGARFREMVCCSCALLLLTADNGFEDGRSGIDGSCVGECPMEHQHPRAIPKDVCPFRLQLREPGCIVYQTIELITVVHGNSLPDVRRITRRAVVARFELVDKFIERAITLAKPLLPALRDVSFALFHISLHCEPSIAPSADMRLS